MQRVPLPTPPHLCVECEGWDTPVSSCRQVSERGPGSDSSAAHRDACTRKGVQCSTRGRSRPTEGACGSIDPSKHCMHACNWPRPCCRCWWCHAERGTRWHRCGATCWGSTTTAAWTHRHYQCNKSEMNAVVQTTNSRWLLLEMACSEHECDHFSHESIFCSVTN